jgi:hypothetical protein
LPHPDGDAHAEEGDGQEVHVVPHALEVAAQVAFESKGLKPGYHFIRLKGWIQALSSYGSTAEFNLHYLHSPRLEVILDGARGDDALNQLHHFHHERHEDEEHEQRLRDVAAQVVHVKAVSHFMGSLVETGCGCF